jgi:hypothetical protein
LLSAYFDTELNLSKILSNLLSAYFDTELNLSKKLSNLPSNPDLVVKAEDSWFKPPTEETIFQAPFIRIKSLEQKLSEINLALLHML